MIQEENIVKALDLEFDKKIKHTIKKWKGLVGIHKESPLFEN